MNRCTNCGTEFEGKFCPECGAKAQTEPVCPSCGEKVKEGMKFCPNCGYSFALKTARTAPEEASHSVDDIPPPCIIDNRRKRLRKGRNVDSAARKTIAAR